MRGELRIKCDLGLGNVELSFLAVHCSGPILASSKRELCLVAHARIRPLMYSMANRDARRKPQCKVSRMLSAVKDQQLAWRCLCESGACYKWQK